MNSSDRQYGVLLLSFSRHSHQRSFVPLFQAHPRIQLVAVADDDSDIEPYLRKLNRQWARELGIPYVEDVDDALALSGVDIVSIGHEIERRADLCTRSARAGRHLWIDKFLGASVEECDAVTAAVAESGICAIVPSYSYGSLVTRCHQVIQSGSIGELMGVHVDILFGKGWPAPIPDEDRVPFTPAGRWKYPDLKRELLTVGAYSVGLLQGCFSEITEVAAHGDAFFFPVHARRGCEDFATVILRDRKGRTATLCAGRSGVATHPAGGPSEAWLVGTGATVYVDAKRPSRVQLLRDEVVGTDHRPSEDDPMQWASGGAIWTPAFSADTAGLAAGLDEFVQALDEGRNPTFSAAQARDNMEILLAGYRSIEIGEPVTLPLARETSP
ncbi:MAG: Gfo/Idh/MocA family oxidoreductase [Candidatus Latescibacterota bacterium]|nr:Gfo/Idh/MocA family oxidoreductase [Candidatus Latescibacterota bacterium]